MIPGEYATILNVDECNNLRRRFFDIGLIRGTRVKCVAKSPGKDMKAFMIRGAVIAIRNTDSRTVSVRRERDTVWD
ncbi:MAG: ferrous iron transport protein A [Clostridia bacterium]|nr:ferrous iron transport protein A [Clostridia bacterium]